MGENPWQPLLQTLEKLTNCLQTHLSNFMGTKSTPRSSSSTIQNPISSESPPLIATNNSNLQKLPLKDKSIGGPVTKEELGRATWTFLHTLAAQELGVGPAITVHSVLHDWIRHDGKLSFFRFLNFYMQSLSEPR